MGVREVGAAYADLSSAADDVADAASQGYRQTEVGLVPDDWKIASLGSLTDPQRPISYGIVQTGPSISNGVRCLRVLDIDDGRIKGDGLITTTTAISDAYKRTILRVGDLVMPLRGKVGEVALVCKEFADCNLTRGIALVAISPDSSALFFKHFISSFASRNRLEQCMNGSALQELPIATLRAFKVSFPTNAGEQEAIAEVLSDADALTESLQQLIAKKRQIKQGAMQALLTGQQRLPGFTAEWDTTSLGDIADRIVGGGTPSRSVTNYWGGDIPWMTVKDFACHSRFGTIESITKEGLERSASHRIPRGTLITSTRMGLGKAVIFEVDVSINQDLKAIFLRKDMNAEFVYHWFELNEPRIAELGSGSTVMGLSLVELKKIAFHKPSISEQAAITTVLTDMNTEIAALETRLSKTREIKQGMMQALLAGAIRLPLEQAA